MSIKTYSIKELEELASEIRKKIITVLSKNGGHLSSNLGIVELTIALHYVFSSPYDKFLFDTSHQIYTHKLLTGREPLFETLRMTKGLSGFSHPKESIHDPFYMGHAGTAFSLALGMAKAREGNEHIIPILGDASFNSGLTLEALNLVPKELKNFILVLNDNKMAISQSVGNFRQILKRLINHPKSNLFYEKILHRLSRFPHIHNIAKRLKESFKNLISGDAFFEHFGLSYVGPIDGHNLDMLIKTFEALKNTPHPVLVHVLTKKGKGMESAMLNPTIYHGARPFDIISGKFTPTHEVTFPKIFGKKILSLAEKEPFHVICPAMLEGSCLAEFAKKYPDRCTDVGIAEAHALTFAGGYGKTKKVIISIYSSFLQRAFDSLFHDICLQESPVIFAIDRAGLSGPDGITHHGIYDLTFLLSMPNLIIAAPRNGTVLEELLESAFSWEKPSAIRYPNLPTTRSPPLKKRIPGQAELLKEGKDLLLLPLGHMVERAFEVVELLKPYDIDPTIIDPVFVKPLDEKTLEKLLLTHHTIITLEEHALINGFGSYVSQKFGNRVKVISIGIEDHFVEHGSYEDLQKELGLDAHSIVKRILGIYDHSALS